MLVFTRKETKNSEAKLCMPRQFQYVKMEHRRYFCLQQNPAVLAWALFFKKNTLRPAIRISLKKWSLRWIISEIWRHYYISRTNLSIFTDFVKYKYNIIRNNNPLVELPVYGQICVPVHKGFKIFNLQRGTVIKIFKQNVNKSVIVNEVEHLKNVFRIDFASSIKRWDFDARWYEEDFISGSLDNSLKPRDSTTLLKKFYRDIVPCLESLILYKRPMTKNVIEHINDILSLFEVSKLPSRKLDIQKVHKIRNFINSTVERLHSEGNLSAILVFTHGDFCPANILNTRRKVRVLDWESANYRSMLFDFYSYFFFRPVHQSVPVKRLVSEINEALPFYISRLSLNAPDLSKNLLHLEKVYRWLYYIERVCMLVERERTDTRLNIMKHILGFIDTFDQYEELLSTDGG